VNFNLKHNEMILFFENITVILIALNFHVFLVMINFYF